MTPIQGALVDRVDEIEGFHDGARRQHFDLQPPARHVVHLLGEVERVLVEDVLGRPRALELEGGRFRRFRDHRESDRCRTAGRRSRLQELAPSRLDLPRTLHRLFPRHIYFLLVVVASACGTARRGVAQSIERSGASPSSLPFVGAALSGRTGHAMVRPNPRNIKAWREQSGGARQPSDRRRGHGCRRGNRRAREQRIPPFRGNVLTIRCDPVRPCGPAPHVRPPPANRPTRTRDDRQPRHAHNRSNGRAGYG